MDSVMKGLMGAMLPHNFGASTAPVRRYSHYAYSYVAAVYVSASVQINVFYYNVYARSSAALQLFHSHYAAFTLLTYAV